MAWLLGLGTTVKALLVGALIVLLTGLAFFIAWKWQEGRIAGAVEAAEKVLQDNFDEERRIVAKYQGLSDARYTKLAAAVANIKSTTTTIRQGVAAERAKDPVFYQQQVPEGGKAQWRAAKDLVRQSAQP